MKRWIQTISLVCTLGFGSAIFYIKYQVLALETDLLAVQREIYQTHESLHVLKAEWAYLNEPQRLQQLVSHHLDLQPARPLQLIATAALPKPKRDSVFPHPETCETLLCQNQSPSTWTQ